jgi:hypothetical protein
LSVVLGIFTLVEVLRGGTGARWHAIQNVVAAIGVADASVTRATGTPSPSVNPSDSAAAVAAMREAAESTRALLKKVEDERAAHEAAINQRLAEFEAKQRELDERERELEKRERENKDRVGQNQNTERTEQGLVPSPGLPPPVLSPNPPSRLVARSLPQRGRQQQLPYLPNQRLVRQPVYFSYCATSIGNTLPIAGGLPPGAPCWIPGPWGQVWGTVVGFYR